jgi:hypothetical protein
MLAVIAVTLWKALTERQILLLNNFQKFLYKDKCIVYLSDKKRCFGLWIIGCTRRETARYEILNVLHRLKQLFNHMHAIKQFCLAFFPQITGEIVSVSRFIERQCMGVSPRSPKFHSPR